MVDAKDIEVAQGEALPAEEPPRVALASAALSQRLAHRRGRLKRQPRDEQQSEYGE